MPSVVVVWLVIRMAMPGQPEMVLADEVQPDLATCWAAAARAVERAGDVDGPFEFMAACSIVKMPGDPA